MPVSVIVPMYNCEKYIERCVRSILNQTYSELEIILINDGSNDQTLRIAEALSREDGRIVLLTQENQGVAAARNHGLSISRGEYVAFVDADDYIEPDMIESLLSVADTDTLAVCDFLYNNTDVRAYQCEKDCIEIDDSFSARFLLGDYANDLFLSVWNKLFSLERIRRNAIQFPAIKIGEDMLFVVRYSQCIKRVRILHKCLYHYCIYDNSAVNSTSKDYLPVAVQTYHECCNPQYKLNQQMLSFVAEGRMLTVVNSGYIAGLSRAQFKDYFETIKNTDLFQVMQKRPVWQGYISHKKNIKRIVLRAALRLGSPSLVYLLIHSYRHFLHKRVVKFYADTQRETA